MNDFYSRRSFLSWVWKGATLVLLSGCTGIGEVFHSSAGRPQASVPPQHPQVPAASREPCIVRTSPNPTPEGCFVHEVAPMETVPRLAQMYGVSEQSIYKVNDLKSGQALCPGSQIIIPRPTRYKNIVPVYRNNIWKYIVVHHTAGEYGKALFVDQMHRERGFEEGLGYHFLIDNGTLGKGNGQLEVGPRWIKQEQGAHCKAGGMNHVGIGIGLVGNFNNDLPSKAQMLTLVKLVDTLAGYYRIPEPHVIGHRDAPGAQTDCPGKRFPWDAFMAGLANSSRPISSNNAAPRPLRWRR